MDAPSFIQSPFETQIAQFGAIMNKAIIDLYLQVSVFIVLTSGAHQFLF